MPDEPAAWNWNSLPVNYCHAENSLIKFKTSDKSSFFNLSCFIFRISALLGRGHVGLMRLMFFQQ